MNNQSNQFKLYIPSEISSDSNLNLSEMRILATIKALDNEYNCYASNSYLSECTGLSIRQVSRIITSLVKKCYILVENAKSFKRKIKVAKDKVVQTAVEVKDKVQAKVQSKKESSKPAQLKQKINNYQAGKVSNKVQKFNTMYSHDWDFDSIERLESLKISLDIGQISEEEYIELAEPLLRKMNMMD